MYTELCSPKSQLEWTQGKCLCHYHWMISKVTGLAEGYIHTVTSTKEYSRKVIDLRNMRLWNNH